MHHIGEILALLEAYADGIAGGIVPNLLRDLFNRLPEVLCAVQDVGRGDGQAVALFLHFTHGDIAGNALIAHQIPLLIIQSNGRDFRPEATPIPPDLFQFVGEHRGEQAIAFIFFQFGVQFLSEFPAVRTEYGLKMPSEHFRLGDAPDFFIGGADIGEVIIRIHLPDDVGRVFGHQPVFFLAFAQAFGAFLHEELQFFPATEGGSDGQCAGGGHQESGRQHDPGGLNTVDAEESGRGSGGDGIDLAECGYRADHGQGAAFSGGIREQGRSAGGQRNGRFVYAHLVECQVDGLG